MALSPSERIFLTKLKDAGYTTDQLTEALKKQRAKKSESFAGRLNLATQDISPETAVKGEAITQATQDLNAAPDKTSVMDVVSGKKNIYGEDLEAAKEQLSEEHPVLSAIGENAAVLNPVGTTVETGKGLLKAGAGVLGLAETATDKLGITEDTGETLGQKIQESDALKSDAALGKGLNFIGQYIIPTIAGGAVGGTLGKLGGKSKIANGALTFLGSSLGGTTAYSTVDRGELPTGEELSVGAAIDLATLGLGKLFKKIAPQIFRVGANPTGKNYLDIEWKAGEATGKYAGTKKMIVNQANNVIKQASKQMDELVGDAGQSYSRSFLASGADEVADEVATANPELAASIKEFARSWESGADGAIKVDEFSNAKGLREIKTKIGNMLSTIFDKDKTGDLKIASRAQGLLGVWNKIDEALDAISPQVAELNKQMNVAYAVKNPLELALEKPWFQNILAMLNPKNIPGVTPVSTTVAATLKGIADMPGVPESVKIAILEALGEL